jgi:hypothetical protein
MKTKNKERPLISGRSLFIIWINTFEGVNFYCLFGQVEMPNNV